MYARSGVVFRQIFDRVSCTYTYLLASQKSRKAVIIDPVIEAVPQYLRVFRELDVNLVKALDTHVHADHVTAIGELRNLTKCMTIMSEYSSVDNVAQRVKHGDIVEFDCGNIRVHHTPGHTDDSVCYEWQNCLFTGDTLLIRGTGRTDFQNGDSFAAYDSLFNKLLKFDDETWVYPGHDYKGETVSTIGEERHYNPRLQVKSAEEYAELMANLNLPTPQFMDVAVPANQVQSMKFEELNKADAMLSISEYTSNKDKYKLVDLRNDSERDAHGKIEKAMVVPYDAFITTLQKANKNNICDNLSKIMNETKTDGKEIAFFCAYGERAAIAALTLQEMGIKCKAIIAPFDDLKSKA